MFPVEAFERTVVKFVSIAESIELPFHLTGGSISSAYGEPRLTQDIDIVVSPEVAKNRVAELVELLVSSDLLFTESVVRKAVQTGELFQLLDKSESLKLDIYPRELIAGELQRSQTFETAVVHQRSVLAGRYPISSSRSYPEVGTTLPFELPFEQHFQ